MKLTIITSPFSLVSLDEPHSRGGLGPGTLLADGLVETLRGDGHDVTPRQGREGARLAVDAPAQPSRSKRSNTARPSAKSWSMRVR